MGMATEWVGEHTVQTWLQSYPWEQTPLGSVATWPPGLRTSFTILLQVDCPAALIWGSDRTFLCNNAYRALFPSVPFGQSINAEWAVQTGITPVNVEPVFATGQAGHWYFHGPEAYQENSEASSLWRSFSGSCSAIWNDQGQVDGVFILAYPLPSQISTCTLVNSDQSIETIPSSSDCEDQDDYIRKPSRNPIPEHIPEQVTAILESITDGFLAVDREWRFTYLNPEGERTLGRSRQELMGKNLWEEFPELAETSFGQLCRRAMADGKPLELEDYYPPFEAFFAVRAYPSATGLALYFRNINERKQAEIALQRREEQLRLITDAIPVLIAYVDKAYIYRFSNRTYEVWFGKSINDVVDHPVSEVLGLSAYEAVLPYMNQALAGQRVSYESQISYRDGGTRYISASYIPHFNSQGEVEGFFGLVSDISDRKRAEEALRLSEERAQLAIQVGRLGTWDYNPVTNWVNLDERMREIWGESQDAISLPLDRVMERIHPEERERVAIAIAAALNPQSSGTYEIDYRIVWDDGSEHWVLSNGQVLFAGEGQQRQAVGFFGTALDITQRKQAEESLRQSEERLRLAMQGAQMGTWDVDLITGRAIWSEQHFSMLGYEPVASGEATELLWSQRIHPDDLNRVLEEWQRSRQEHRLYRAEYRVIHPNGRTLWLSALGSFTYDTQDNPIRSIGVLFDITDRKQAESELQQSEERLRLAVTAARMVAWAWDAQSDRLVRSDTACEILGLPPEALDSTGLAGWQLVHPDDLPTHQTRVEEAIATGGSYRSEIRMIRPDNGRVIWVEDRGKVTQNEQGNLVRVEGILFDITVRKQTEEALRQSEQRLKLAQQSARVGTWEWDLTTNVCTWSDGIWNLLKLEPGSVRPSLETFTQFIHPEDLEAAMEHAQAVLADPDEQNYYDEFRVICQDGSVCWLVSQGRVLRDEQGGAERLLGVNIDITHRKQAEAEREQLLEREKTAREQAETANRIKDEFLAVLSHELRSPLNPILGWARLLQTGSLDAQKTHHALATIERNAKLQTQLIEDLLDVSRILRGKLVLSYAPVNLITVLEGALETVRLAAEAKSIPLHLTVLPSVSNGAPDTTLTPTQNPPFQVLGDAARLQQIFWNLLSNAVKFTASGGSVNVRLELIEGGYAQVQVQDTGKGIHSDFLPYVFEYFRQEDGTTTRKFGGLGLGLAIARHLTELHGGRIQVSSPGDGQGSTFTVQLPLVPGPATKPHPGRFQKRAVDLSHLHILVVDDEADIRDIMAFTLRQAGAQVSVAPSAREALNLLRSPLPDLLICDIGMPDIDGYTLMRQIRTRSPEEGGAIAAIAFTAYAGEMDRRQALEVGFQLHLAKPVEPDALVQAIANLM